MKLLIIGGVAGGASCAARARRLSEDAEIIIFDRGAYVSFANCGLPYYVGDVIKDEKKLLIATPELFKERFNIQVRLKTEILSIDLKTAQVQAKELDTGRIYSEKYDALVLSPGAAPIKPPLPGVELPGIFYLRTIPDSRKIREWIQSRKARSAVVIGGGFIGLEMAENLVHCCGLKVSILELQKQVLPPFDPEMVQSIHEDLKRRGLSLHLGDALTGFEAEKDGSLIVLSQSGLRLKTDLVILSIGVKPETQLAQEAGLSLGLRKGVFVNEFMQTSDPHVWAVGDVTEKHDFLTGESVTVPLAGPANRQGRIAADNIFGRKTSFRGVQATAVCKIFNKVAAMTGASEKTLSRLKLPFEKIYLHPGHHAGYYPDSKPIDLKLLFSTVDGRVLGAQAVGEEGVEKRIDIIAMAVQMGATVYDLEEAELCYAPQFGAAKDPVNVAGMIASNFLRGDVKLIHWERINFEKDFLLDVRTRQEYEEMHVPRAVNIPLNSLRDEISKMPSDKIICVYCGVGQRAYYAVRVLHLHGYDARNISGGIQSYQAWLSSRS